MIKLSDTSLSVSTEGSLRSSADPVIRPWYREPWPWLLASIPFATVIAGGFTLSLAIIRMVPEEALHWMIALEVTGR